MRRLLILDAGFAQPLGKLDLVRAMLAQALDQSSAVRDQDDLHGWIKSRASPCPFSSS
jgi:hypothetical protein